MRNAELKARLEELQSDPLTAMYDLLCALRHTTGPSRIASASGRGLLLDMSPRQPEAVADVQIVKPEPSASKSSSWAQLCNDALAVASNLFRQRNLPLSKIVLRKRPAVDEYTPVKRSKSSR